MKRLLLIVALAVISAPASAGWTGCYLGGHLGVSNINDDVNFSDVVVVNGFGDSSFLAGGLVGCDYQFANNVVVGAFGDYSWTDHGISVNTVWGNGSLSYGDQWSVGGRVGMLLTENTLLYLLAAYTGLSSGDLKIHGTNYSVGSRSGYALGGGIQTDLSTSWKAGLEYRRQEYGSKTVALDETSTHWAKADPSVDTVRLSLTYHFGQTEEEAPPLLK